MIVTDRFVKLTLQHEAQMAHMAHMAQRTCIWGPLVHPERNAPIFSAMDSFLVESQVQSSDPRSWCLLRQLSLVRSDLLPARC